MLVPPPDSFAMVASASAGSSYRAHSPSPLRTARPPRRSTSTAVDGDTTASEGAATSGRSKVCASICQAVDTTDDPRVRHVAVMVGDGAAAEPLVLALGARRLPAPEGDWRVYADPAGRPFCLIPRPSWAPPVLRPVRHGPAVL